MEKTIEARDDGTIAVTTTQTETAIYQRSELEAQRASLVAEINQCTAQVADIDAMLAKCDEAEAALRSKLESEIVDREAQSRLDAEPQ